MSEKIPAPVVIGVIVVLVLVVGYFLFKGATGGTVGGDTNRSMGEPGGANTRPVPGATK